MTATPSAMEPTVSRDAPWHTATTALPLYQQIANELQFRPDRPVEDPTDELAIAVHRLVTAVDRIDGADQLASVDPTKARGLIADLAAVVDRLRAGVPA